VSDEQQDVLDRFLEELSHCTQDGGRKRGRGEKAPWWIDRTHEAAVFSHITRWKRGELVDPDSGAHPLVHAAWRCLAIACQETKNVPRLSLVTQGDVRDGDQGVNGKGSAA
jgi:hypothetical protein